MVTKGNHSNDFVICPEDGLYERWFRPTNRRFQLRLGTEEVLGAMASSITYDTCKFNPPPSSEFVCAVCHCVLHEPRMCVCRHIFCKVCIETWLNRSSTCPSCRSHATLRQLQVAPPLVVNVLNGLTMDCEYKEKGCDITISMEKFPSHVTSCEYRVATCSHKDCNVETTVRALPKHKKECPYRMEQCRKDCRLQFPFYKLEGHDCFRALRDTVDELNNTVRRYQVVLSWVRKKLNLFHMPHQSAGVQLQGYQDMMEDVNRFWPPDQHIPLNLCGDYVVPSAAAASGSSRGSGRGDGAEVLQGASQLGSSILERLVAEASTPEQERHVFGPRYPDEADGPSARVRREHPARGIAPEMSTPPLHSSSQRAMERLGSPSFQFLDQSLAALTPLPTPHRPLPFSSTAPPPRSSRSPNRPAPSTEPQARPHGSGLASSPASPEPFRSDNSGIRSYPSPGSSIDFSSYSDEERYTPLSPRMPLHLRSVHSTDYLPVDNHPYDDALYPALRYSRLAHRSDLAPHNARPRNQSRSRSRSGSRFRGRSYRARTSRSRSYSRSRSRSFGRSRSRSYSRSRSRSYSPARLYSPRRSYTPARSFSSARSYSPSGRFSPSGSYSQSRSYSRSRSHSRSRSRSSDGGNNSRSQFRRGRYSQSPPLSQSRSSSTSRRSVRARSRSRSWEHRQTRSRSQSYDSSNTSNMNSDRLLSQAGEEDQMDEWTPDSMNTYDSANASSDDHSGEGHHSQLSGPESQSVASESFRDGVYQSPGSSSGGRENSNCTSSAAGGFPFPEAAQRRTSEDLSDGDYWMPLYRQGSHHSAADRNRSLAGSEDWSAPSNENQGQEGRYSQQDADRCSSHAALAREDGNGGVTSSSPDRERSRSNARLPSSPVAVSSSPVVVSSSPDRSPAHKGGAAADHAQPSSSSSTQRGGDADGVKRVLPQPLSHSYAKQGSSVAVSEREMNSKERGASGSSMAQQTDNGGFARDGKRGKIPDQEASRNVWESSSDATSLDYDLPESPALSPQLGLSTEQHDNGTTSAGLGGVGVPPEEVGAGRDFERVASSTQDLGHGVKDESESGVQNGDKIDDQAAGTRRQFSFQPLDSDHDSPNKGRKGKVAGSSKGKGKALLKSKTNLLSESESYSDSICYKRKAKAKSLPMSSNDEGSSDEEVNQAVQRKVVHEDSANSNSNPAAVANLPSTSSTSLKLTLKIKHEEETKAKNKKKIKKEGHELNPNQTNSQKHETESKKRKAGRSKQHKSTKKARLSGPPAKDVHRSGTHSHNTTHPTRRSNPQPKKHTHAATVTTAHSTSLPQLQSSATTSQRAESETWVNQAQVEIRRLENESVDRVSTATNSRGQGSRGTASRGSRRSANEGNRSRGYDSRNVGVDATVDRTSRTETSRGRVPPVQGRGLRVVMIENLAAQPAARRRLRGQGGNLRMVRIPDLPVPPTTLDLLNQYDDSDESDCTWSPSSSDDSDFRQR